MGEWIRFPIQVTDHVILVFMHDFKHIQTFGSSYLMSETVLFNVNTIIHWQVTLTSNTTLVEN